MKPFSSSEAPSDAELVARLHLRDEAALGELYDRHAGAVYGLALRVLTEEHAAREVVQDVFLTLWERPARYDPARAGVRVYLVVMARSKALDRLRREKPSLPLYDEDGEEYPLPGTDATPQERSEHSQEQERVRAAMAALSAAHRETVERAYYRDESREEIAAAMQVPVGTVKSRLKYALDKLRAVLAPQLGWPGRDG